MDYSALYIKKNTKRLKAGDVIVFSKGEGRDLYITTHDNIAGTCQLVSLSNFHVCQMWNNYENMLAELEVKDINGYHLTEIIPSKELKLTRI